MLVGTGMGLGGMAFEWLIYHRASDTLFFDNTATSVLKAKSLLQSTTVGNEPESPRLSCNYAIVVLKYRP